MARADMHVFGSVSGYRTIAASVGLRPDETRELEHFQFGEISTSDAIARLETQPTMTSRMLSSGRMALSRMLPAGVDDAGRPTIEIVTFVVDAKSYHTSLGSLAVLADDASFWVAARDNARAGFDLPRGDALLADPRDPALLRILDAWMLATRTGSVATLPESSMADLLRFVATLDPSDRARCRWGLGINSLSAPVDVCTMMPGASTHGARSIVRPALAGQWHVRETEFAQFRATSGGSTWVPTAQMIGAATVSSAESSVGDARDAFASTSAHRALSDRQKRVMVMSVIAAICSTLLFTVAATVYLGTASSRSNNVVLAGGVDSDAGDQSTPLPPIGGSRRSGFGEAIEIPVVSAPTETVGPTEQPAAAPEPEPEFETVYPDKDGDGYGDGDPKKSKQAVKGSTPKGYVSKAGDCNDSDDAINPDARETCDNLGIDNNCDDDSWDVDPDSGVVTAFYRDEDGDGLGDPNDSKLACQSTKPVGYVPNNHDPCPKNKWDPGICGCDWKGPAEDSDGDGVLDCKDPDYDQTIRLRNELELVRRDAEMVESLLQQDLLKCDAIKALRGSQAFEVEVNKLAATLNQRLAEVDTILRAIYEARLLGDFGTFKLAARPLAVNEKRDVHCRWQDVLERLKNIGTKFNAANSSGLFPKPASPRMLHRDRLDAGNPEVGWPVDTFENRPLCSWVLDLLYTEDVIDREIKFAERHCESPIRAPSKTP